MLTSGVWIDYREESWLCTHLFPNLKYMHLSLADREYKSEVLKRETGLEIRIVSYRTQLDEALASAPSMVPYSGLV